MTIPLRPHYQQGIGTYVFQPQQSKEELEKLALQDRLITKAMGGVLGEQKNPEAFRRVLDIACGSGSWVIEAAQQYPHMSLVGIDVNEYMIEFAAVQAAVQRVEERVEFQMMDALRVLEFPDDSFDLVNMRFVQSFLRTWDWPRLLRQILRILRPGGVIRLTEEEVIHRSNSPAALQFYEMVQCALFRSGHLFAQESDGLTAHLAPLLGQHGYEQVATKMYALHFTNETPAGKIYKMESAVAMRALRPFLHKWGCLSGDFDALSQQIVQEAQQPDFCSCWHLLTAWGVRPTLPELSALV